MDAINGLSPPAPAPDSVKLTTPAVAVASVSKNTGDGVDIVLSENAQQSIAEKPQESSVKQTKSLEEQTKEGQKAGQKPSPSLGKAFYNFDQIQTEKAKEARQEELKETAKHLSNYLQYTNNYLAQLAYAKIAADQPVILPQPAGPQDLIAKLNLFS